MSFSYYVKFIVLLFVITFCLYVLIVYYFLLQVIEQRCLVAVFSERARPHLED